MRWMFLSLLSLGLGLGAWSCGPTHCGYNGGDGACAARDPNTPFCDLCLQDNDGCVASEPIDAGCVLAGDSGSVDTLPPSTSPPPGETTYVSDPTTQGPGSLSAGTTDPTVEDPTTTNPPQTVTSAPGDTTDVSTSTSETTASTSTTADDTTSGPGSTSTADDTTSGESTSTTSDETTGPPPPMCGNDVVEGGEVCDGSDLAGKQCTDFPGKGGGTLVCNAMCSMFDQAGCCLANGQACQNNGQCCINSCKFDLFMAKNICK